MSSGDPKPGELVVASDTGAVYVGVDAGTAGGVAVGGGGGGSGDVVGPSSAVDGNLASFNTTTGKLIKDSGIAAADVTAKASETALNTTHRTGDGSDHADVAANTAASHAESHTVASHSDTTATGAELETLTDVSNSDALHVHTASGITDFDTEVSNNASVAANTAKVTNATHTGDVTGSGALTIAAGAVDIAHLSATGTPDGTTFLRGDNAWSTPAGSGDVSKVGTPVNNQVGVWTGDGTLEGDADLTFDGTNLDVTGNITVGGTVDGIDIATDVAANTAASHAESHTVASHSDTTATGAELEELTDGSTTTLHAHASPVEDDVYGAGWNGDTANAPSQNAVYDKINAMDTTIASNTSHALLTNNPHSVDAVDVGLGNVDNTADSDKPVSTATQTALNAKEDSLTFDTVPTAASTNPVESNGVFDALALKAASSHEHDIDSLPDFNDDVEANTVVAANTSARHGHEYASFHLTTGGRTTLEGTEVILVLDKTRYNSNGSVFALASNQVTVSKTATFVISVDVYLNMTAASRSEFSIYLKKNGTEMTATRSASYQRGYDDGMTCSINVIEEVTTGDYFEIACIRTDAGGTSYQDDNGTRFNIWEIG